MSNYKYGIKRVDVTPMYFASAMVGDPSKHLFTILLFDTESDAQEYIDSSLALEFKWRIDIIRCVGLSGSGKQSKK